MAHGSKAFRFGAAFAAFGMVLSSTAHAAPGALSQVDPLVSLSAFGTSASRAAVCAAGNTAANAAGTAVQSGPSCALPFLAAASAVASSQQVVAYAPEGERRRPLFAALAPAIGLFTLGVIIILLIDDDDGDTDFDDGDSPD